MPALVRLDAAALPMVTVPNTSNAPVLVTGPSRLIVAVPGPEGPAVSVPSLSSPAETDRVAPVDPAPAVPAPPVPPVPTVSELPLATVSSPTTMVAFWSTVAPPGMHASTPAASGTPVLQLPAVLQSVVPAPPVQVSVQLSTVSAAGATPMPVAP